MLFPEGGKFIFKFFKLGIIKGKLSDNSFDGVGNMENSILLNKLDLCIRVEAKRLILLLGSHLSNARCKVCALPDACPTLQLHGWLL